MLVIEFNTKTSIPVDKILCIKEHEGKTFVHVAQGVFFEVSDSYLEAQAKLVAATSVPFRPGEPE